MDSRESLGTALFLTTFLDTASVSKLSAPDSDTRIYRIKNTAEDFEVDEFIDTKNIKDNYNDLLINLIRNCQHNHNIEMTPINANDDQIYDGIATSMNSISLDLIDNMQKFFSANNPIDYFYYWERIINTSKSFKLYDDLYYNNADPIPKASDGSKYNEALIFSYLLNLLCQRFGRDYSDIKFDTQKLNTRFSGENIRYLQSGVEDALNRIQGATDSNDGMGNN